MNDINRLLIFLSLIGLLYALYKYQNIIFNNLINCMPKNNKKPKKPKHITADNISQLSIGSIENEKYKQESNLGSLGNESDANSLFDNLTEGSSASNMSLNSDASLFF